jgi:uncharacterized protein (DUF433 family)
MTCLLGKLRLSISASLWVCQNFQSPDWVQRLFWWSLDREFQKETKNAKRLLELFPKYGKISSMTTFGSLNRITVDPGVMSGHPCIRGMRVTVSNVLRLLAAHHDKRRILEAYHYLEEEDISTRAWNARLCSPMRAKLRPLREAPHRYEPQSRMG